jgi:hypothetical protein
MSNTIGSAAGKRGDAADTQSNEDLAALAKQFNSETQDLRQGIISELTDALGGGVSGAQQSLISQSIENSLQAGAQARGQVSDELARTGLSGTPFGISQLASTISQGNQATSQIGPQLKNQMYNQALQQAASFVLGQSATSMSGLGTAGTNTTQLSNTNLQGIYKTFNMGK